MDLGIPGLVDAAVIGRGGFGVVYRARQPELNRVVAVKVLSTVLDDPSQVRFAREGYAMGTVGGHPHIVQVLSVGVTAGGRPYLLMPLLAGGSLAERLPIPVEEAVAHTVKLCGALETAHRAGVLHRDLKPANVLISAFGEPQLGDFGISRVSGGFETSEGLVSASVPYAAPEIFAGQAPTAAADVYSLAATLFATITGEPPFGRGAGEELVATYLRISRDPVPDLRPRGVPGSVCEVLEAAMEKDPAERIRSAAELGRRLQDAQRAVGWPVVPMALTAAGAGAAPEGTATVAVELSTAPEPATPGPTEWQPPRPPAAPTLALTQPAAPAPPGSRPGRRLAATVAGVTAAALLTGGAIQFWPERDGDSSAVSAETAAPSASPTAAGAAFGVPAGLAVGPDGAGYVADSDGHRVWRVTSDGTLEPFLGTGEGENARFGGPAAEAKVSYPTAVAVGSDGTVYVGGDGHLLQIGEDRVVRLVTGFGDDYLHVYALAVGGDGLYVSDGEKVRLRRDDGSVEDVTDTIDGLAGIAAHPDGGIVYAAGNRVYRVESPGADPVPVAGSAAEEDGESDGRQALATVLSTPTALAFDSEGRLHIAEAGEGRVRRLEQDGTLLTVVGNPGPDGSTGGDAGDGGPARDATFGLISAIVFDGSDNLYIADTDNRRVRRVAPDGERRIDPVA